ncbi:cob(I)yrinic acid a,c-diamide adenosyltransferase [Prochlorococcus sp. MIT 1341]|uniref:cob(I)yrinic acid a,c-diamide adenosyltransferase n=1 Tax=Prochlorococcus sp. MIT 1341 TaxID=3096221 RepID=UPI002A757BD9|nr:cob(I)yrinic acid a,c-diamide adenosyltransferase [Prochlorococcus sp. MIT 1341]
MADATNQEEGENSLDQAALELGIGGKLSPDKDDLSYKKRMSQRQKIQKQRVNSRQKEKGLILVFTGNGKGKTTAALGLALRTLGHGEKVAIVQFIKGSWEPGEAKAFEKFGDSLEFHALGEGFTWNTQDRERDASLVANAWEKSLDFLKRKEHKLVILDEINIALKLGYLSLDQVLIGLGERPPLKHVVLTGRGAPKELIDIADLVTEMSLVHHPFKEQGIKAQKGIEF